VTEQDWLACTDPERMLNHLRGRASDRKLRLLACACVRRLWPLVYDERGRQAVAAVERLSDGDTTAEGLSLARQAALKALVDSPDLWPAARPLADAVLALTDADVMNAARAGVALLQLTHRHLLHEVFGNPFRPVAVSPAWHTSQVLALAQAAYDERELPAGTLDAARLAVLADALEEAGCTEEVLVRHLRGEEVCPGCAGKGVIDRYSAPPTHRTPTRAKNKAVVTSKLQLCARCGGGKWVRSDAPHVRGCWAVDLLLGKS
jgi:hypothetical protein